MLMNNQRLLIALLAATLSGTAAVADVSSEGLPGEAEQPGRVYTLEEIFQVAESSSSQLRPFLTAEDEARLNFEAAKSSRLPDINANVSVSFIGDGFTTRRDLSDYEKAPIPHFGQGARLAVNQPLYTGGAITESINMASLQSVAATRSTELKRSVLRFQLTSFYLDLYRCANQRRVLDSNIRRAEMVLDEMKARYEQGTALQNDITRYELLLSNLRLQLIKVNNLSDILNNNLVVSAGLPEGTIVRPDTAIIARALPQQGEEWWQTEASFNSPSLKLAHSEVDIARSALKLSKAERLPKIGIEAAWTLDGPILVEVPPINRNLSYWYVGLGVSYNISSLYKSNKTIAGKRAATVKATENLEAAREDLEMAVRADYTSYLEAYAEYDTCLKSVELADDNYRIVLTRYSADMALITDMLDAANSRLDAEQRLVNASINVIYQYYKLLFTSGTI